MVTVTAVVAIAIAISACGGDDGDAPESADIPRDAVATVGDSKISRDDLEAQVSALRRVQPTAVGQAKNGPSRRPADSQLEQQALATLLLTAALEQEAADRGIEGTAARVQQRWVGAASGQFATKKALRRFLGNQTKRDALDQLRLQILTEEIHAQVAEEAGGGRKGADAVREFQADFQRRWRDRTACRKGQQASLCSSK